MDLWIHTPGMGGGGGLPCIPLSPSVPPLLPENTESCPKLVADIIESAH